MVQRGEDSKPAMVYPTKQTAAGRCPVQGEVQVSPSMVDDGLEGTQGILGVRKTKISKYVAVGGVVIFCFFHALNFGFGVFLICAFVLFGFIDILTLKLPLKKAKSIFFWLRYNENYTFFKGNPLRVEEEKGLT